MEPHRSYPYQTQEYGVTRYVPRQRQDRYNDGSNRNRNGQFHSRNRDNRWGDNLLLGQSPDQLYESYSYPTSDDQHRTSRRYHPYDDQHSQNHSEGSSVRRKGKDKRQKKKVDLTKAPDWVTTPQKLEDGSFLFAMPNGEGVCQGVEQTTNFSAGFHEWRAEYYRKQAVKDSTTVALWIPKTVDEISSALEWFLDYGDGHKYTVQEKLPSLFVIEGFGSHLSQYRGAAEAEREDNVEQEPRRPTGYYVKEAELGPEGDDEEQDDAGQDMTVSNTCGEEFVSGYDSDIEPDFGFELDVLGAAGYRSPSPDPESPQPSGALIMSGAATSPTQDPWDAAASSAEEGQSKSIPLRNIGIAFALVTDQKKKATFNQPASIHLVTGNRAIVIKVEFLAALLEKPDDPISRKLRSIFHDPLIRLHGYYACNVVARLARLGIRSEVRDTATSARKEEKRSIEHVCRIVAKEMKVDESLAKAYFVPHGDKVYPDSGMIPVLREAFFCQFLGSLRPSTNKATSVGIHGDRVRAVESMMRAAVLSHLSDSFERDLAYDLERSDYRSDYEPKDKSQPGCVSHLRLHCPRLQSMPMPSKTEVIKFDLVFQFYDVDDDRGIGKLCDGVHTAMYGLVYKMKEKCVHIVFPKGVRPHPGYNNIPFNVFSELKLGQNPPANWALAYPALNIDQPRLRIEKISIYGRSEPSVQEIHMYAYANQLLKPQSKGYDPSQMGFLICPSLSSEIKATRWFQSSLENSSMSAFIRDLIESGQLVIGAGLTGNQRESAVAMIAGKEPATLVTGPPGTGKTTTMAEAALAFSAASSRLPSSTRRLWMDQKYPPTREQTYDKRANWRQYAEELVEMCLIVTMTNGATRNVALKLKQQNCQFRMLTSIRYDEHSAKKFYQELKDFTCSSSDFDTLVKSAATLKGIPIFVATAGALAAVASQIAEVGQPSLIMVDEASQMPAFFYASTLSHFKRVDKLAFLGDSKQVRAHKRNLMPDLQSLIDVLENTDEKFVKKCFLDRSFRNPQECVHFLSKERYDHQLKFKNLDAIAPVKGKAHMDWLRFALLEDSFAKGTPSKFNEVEAKFVAQVGAILHRQGTNFIIITGYAAQRAEIAKQLGSLIGKDAAEGKCETIDSFQGQEAQFVVWSLVCHQMPLAPRGAAIDEQVEDPEDAFLTDPRRHTVALSRCIEGQLIVGSKHFLQGMSIQGSTPLTNLWKEAESIKVPAGQDNVESFLRRFSRRDPLSQASKDGVPPSLIHSSYLEAQM